jgi:twitching motility two-component system response regulator PilG
MQGNLSEIDIYSILQLIELGQRTGQLWVESHNSIYQGNKISQEELPNSSPSCINLPQSWFVFFLNGKIVYCQAGDGSLSRIGDYLRHYHIEKQLDDKRIAMLESTNSAEYAYLWGLLEQNIISPKVARSIIHGLVNETLFDLLSLHQGSFIFDLGAALVPQLTTLEITPIATKITKQVKEWKQLYPHIQSPEQLPILSDITGLKSTVPESSVSKLQSLADGKTTLRQLSRHLNRDILTVAKAIYPYVQQGWLQLAYPSTLNQNTQPKSWQQPKYRQGKIVCIEDTIAICEAVKSILEPQGYRAISITNPLEAFSLIFQLKPDLILCDIAMPELDGYEICSMLRHSTAFRHIPIIMLTGKDGFIDRVRARMVGATDYLTKPFTDKELLMLIEKYINVDYSIVG